jgi:hypothetical protein
MSIGLKNRVKRRRREECRPLPLLLLAALLAAILSLPGTAPAALLPSFPADSGLDSLRLAPITVLHAAADRGLAEEIAARARHHHRRIRRDLGLSGEVEATILLVTDRLPESRYRELDRSLAPWFAGAAWAKEQFIAIRIHPGQALSDHDALLAHELTHVILKADFPRMGSWPLWFREGLAMRESKSEGLRRHTALSLATLRRRLIPLDELWVRFPDNEAESRLAYAESFSVIAFLVSRKGHRLFQEFIAALRQEDFEAAYRRTYGTGLGAMEKEWRHFVERRYHWIPLVTGGTAFWILTLAVFFLSLAARRRKSRLLREEWEREERGENWQDEVLY